MTALALTTTGNAGIVAGGVVLIWLVLSAMVAAYGSDRGYPFFPLFVSAAFIGFPVVLLVVTIAAGPRRRR
jgi:hypothetical protein